MARSTDDEIIRWEQGGAGLTPLFLSNEYGGYMLNSFVCNNGMENKGEGVGTDGGHP